jgi:hypothetical protein
MKRLVACGSVFALVSSAVLVSSSSTPAAGATLSVPASYPSINAAIRAAHNGDTVLVYPGTYRENINIDGKYVIVKAASANPALTLIAGPSGRSPILIQHVPSRAGLPPVTIQGFRIAYGSAPSGQGGGITVANGASPVIRGNVIEANSALDGGGILVYNGSSPTIIGNTIRGNHASLFGGGVFAVKGLSPRIYGNLITANTASGGAIAGGGPAGGGIYLENDVTNPAARSYPNVSRNTITNNSASFACGGIMLRTGVNATIAQNVVTSNRSGYGGGIHIETTGAAPSVVGNTITGNSALAAAQYPGSGSGGGVSVFGGSRPYLGGNTISGNRTSYAGAGVVIAEGSAVRLAANTIVSNSVVGQAAGASGGGVYVANSSAHLENNLIRSNAAPLGGGITVLGTGDFVLVNNTVVTNKATRAQQAAGGGILIAGKPSGKASIVNNIFAGNNDYQIMETGRFATYSNNLVTNDGKGLFFSYPVRVGVTTLSRFNGNHNIKYAQGNRTGSPGFVNAAGGNFSLLSSSAAVNAGRTTGAPTADIRGAHRPFAGYVDIGAYEYTG